MAQYKLFQLNTGIPTGVNGQSTIQAGTVQLYANASGILISMVSGGQFTQVGAQWTGAAPSGATVNSGSPFGSSLSISANYGASGIWLPVSLSGLNYVIPAFRLN